MRSHRLITLALASALAVSSVTTATLASDAVAQKLFDDAKALMAAKNFAEACPKLEQSQRIETSEGTLFALGFCHESNGQLASAWLDYKDGLASSKKSGNAHRVDLATQGIARIEPRLSTLTVKLPLNAASGVVTLDGKPFVASSAVPVDGGAHTLRVTADGKKPYETSVQVGLEKDAKTVTVPTLGDMPTALDVATPDDEKKAPTMAYVLVAGGAVFTLGAIGGRIAAVAAMDQRRSDCLQQLATACDDTGKSRVRTWETLSWVSAGLALASFGGAIYLYTTASKKEQAAPAAAFVRVVPNVGGLQLEGAF